MKSKTLTNIYKYTEYRIFLKDWYEECKSNNLIVSYRYIRDKVGYKSPAFFSQIINNLTNISTDTALKFCRFLKLNAKQTDYFNLLVSFDQSKDIKNKFLLLDKIIHFKRPAECKVLFPHQFKYYSNVYYPIIRHVLSIISFYGETDEEYKKIGELLIPPISAKQVKDTIDTLYELGFIEKDGSGKYILTTKNVHLSVDNNPESNDDEKRKESLLFKEVINFIDIAKEVVYKSDYLHRLYRFCTFNVSENQFQEIRQKTLEFLDEIITIASKEEESNRVYNLNIQMFPLSKDIIVKDTKLK